MAATSLNHYLLGLSRLVLDVAAGVCVACSCLGRAIIKCCGLRGAGSSTGGVAGVRLAGAFIMCHGMRGSGKSTGGVDVCLAGAFIMCHGMRGAGISVGGVDVCLAGAIIKCCGLRGAGSSAGVAGVRLVGAFNMCHGMRGAGISAGGVDVCLAGATITRCGLQGAGSSTGGVAGVCLAGALSQVWGAVSCQQVVAQMGLSTGTKGRSWERRLRLFCNAEGKMGREFLRCW